ncbi:TetR/AcrR family transcriptional regulator [Streptomyces capparidis]
MRSNIDGRSTPAVIRDEALRLFAAHGPDAVTVRQIAAAAGVSPGLVVHHFGSKEGLRAAVDGHVSRVIGEVIGELASGPGPTGLLVEGIVRRLPAGSPIPAYLRRLLLTDDETGRRLFRALYDVARAHLDRAAATEAADPGADPAVRAAFLLVNDLAVLLLRTHLTDVLGVDPLSAEGLGRWVPQALAVYAEGTHPAGGAQ